jgi:hypothetical protein
MRNLTHRKLESAESLKVEIKSCKVKIETRVLEYVTRQRNWAGLGCKKQAVSPSNPGIMGWDDRERLTLCSIITNVIFSVRASTVLSPQRHIGAHNLSAVFRSHFGFFARATTTPSLLPYCPLLCGRAQASKHATSCLLLR